MTTAPRTTAPRFGVNYTPTAGWFHHWLDFDLDAVRADLDSIAALGLDHVRVFPLWPLFQPNRTLIRPRAVEQLVALVDAAGERGLDVAVDGLQGHLSSFDFEPAWIRTWHRRNMFTDPDVVDGQAAYLRTLAAALAERPNFLGMTVGNEVNQFSGEPHPDPHRATPEQAGAWLRRMVDACERGAPGRLHLHASYDAAWYLDGHPFTPWHSARIGAATAVHSWVFNGTAQRYGARSTASDQHAAYLVELSKAWAGDPHRPVWLQEVGAPAPHITAADAARFTGATVAAVLDCPDLWGVTWWCSHDVDRSLADFPELEYSLGLLTNDRRVKPAGERLAGAVAAARADWRAPAPRRTAVVVAAGDEVTAPGRSVCGPGGAVFETFMRLAADGARPTAVLAERAGDAAHLAARGITELVHPDTPELRRSSLPLAQSPNGVR
ncbi:glycoside hydrolase 5 family protein [Kitasatospora purpeofusca]|uniref:glycoside hydrolase 5 family protein n=1 Tax=Kitasatospora purpeofusca TaxID=67352 RepID=UPI00224EF8F6|nr:glycosyl hydrolase [Kitasatospora purpeofusca]MCX4758876.1 glycosyl hydrolase [Kitasatospora purpeofusca]WSR30699.1 glycosyl hydrolase [Kitasatospora purpeofusca]WSR38939.1 glycosyl hydrolase [Kitasatospora purpeofusca]